MLLLAFLKKTSWVHVGAWIFKGKRSSKNHKMLLFVSWRNKYATVSGRNLMRQQVPMMFLLPLVYLGTVVCISVEISLAHFGSEIFYGSEVKHYSQIATFYDSVWYAIIEWPLFDAPSSTHGVFTSLVYLSAVAYISVEIRLDSCWCRGYLKGQRSRIYHKLQLFMTLCDMQSSSGNYSMRHQVPMVYLLLLI